MIRLKTASQVDRMRKAGALTASILRRIGDLVRPGTTTREINDYAFQLCKDARAQPLFLNYPGQHPGQPPFPGVICASRDYMVVHGIPDDTPLALGEILSIDFGCKLDGFCGDSAYTFPVGLVKKEAMELMRVTREALYRGIEAAVVGNYLGDISWAIQSHVESHGFGVVRKLVGHGIGRTMHEPPQVPNFGEPGTGPKLRAGMTLAIEPMITLGHYDVETLDDGWTIATKDRSFSAHYEHTIVILSDGPEILTREEGVEGFSVQAERMWA